MSSRNHIRKRCIPSRTSPAKAQRFGAPCRKVQGRTARMHGVGMRRCTLTPCPVCGSVETGVARGRPTIPQWVCRSVFARVFCPCLRSEEHGSSFRAKRSIPILRALPGPTPRFVRNSAHSDSAWTPRVPKKERTSGARSAWAAGAQIAARTALARPPHRPRSSHTQEVAPVRLQRPKGGMNALDRTNENNIKYLHSSFLLITSVL